MEDNYNIDEHLRRSLRNYSEQPAGDSFAAVMEKLAAAKRKRRMFYWLFGGSSSLGLLLLLGYTFTFTNAPRNNTFKTNIPQPPTALAEQQTTQQTEMGQIVETEKSFVQKPVDNRVPIKNNRTEPSALRSLTPRPTQARSFLPAQPSVEPQVPKAESSFGEDPIQTGNTPAEQQQTFAANAPEEKTDSATEPVLPVALPAFYLEQRGFTFSDSSRHEAVPPALDPIALEYAPLLSETWKRYHFLLGLHVDPQVMRFTLTENRDRDALYDSLYGKDFTGNYLNQRRKFNKPVFSYAYGLKAGLAIDKKWEIWLGIGYQRYVYKDVMSPMPFSNTSTITLTSSIQSLDPANATVVYSYASYSAELRRTGQLNRWLRMNNGLGLRVTHLSSQRVSVRTNGYYFSDMSFFNSLSGWGAVMEAKTGAIADLGRRFQFRLSPGLFYSPSSLFNKSYLIKQKPYGFQVEAMLVYVLNR